MHSGRAGPATREAATTAGRYVTRKITQGEPVKPQVAAVKTVKTPSKKI